MSWKKSAHSLPKVKEYFPIHQARITFIFQFILALTKSRSTNLRCVAEEFQQSVNYLVVSIHCQGVSIPIVWECLDKKGGNSNAVERILLLERLFKLIPPSKIEHLLADSAFIGTHWISWLVHHKVNFRIRIRSKDRLLFKNKEIYAIELGRSVGFNHAY